MGFFGLKPSLKLFNTATKSNLLNQNIRNRTQQSIKDPKTYTLYEYKADAFTMKLTKAFSFSIAAYSTSLLLAYVSVFNPKLRPKELTEVEIEESQKVLEEVEHEFNTQQSNFITYSIKKLKNSNVKVYEQIKSDLFYTSLAALGYATAYFVNRSTKRIITKITQKGPYITVHFNGTKRTKLLEEGCFSIKYNQKKGLRQEGTTIFRIYKDQFQRATAEKKIFNLSAMNIIELEGGTYPEGWMRFRNTFYGK